MTLRWLVGERVCVWVCVFEYVCVSECVVREREGEREVCVFM